MLGTICVAASWNGSGTLTKADVSLTNTGGGSGTFELGAKLDGVPTWGQKYPVAKGSRSFTVPAGKLHNKVCVTPILRHTVGRKVDSYTDPFRVVCATVPNPWVR